MWALPLPEDRDDVRVVLFHGSQVSGVVTVAPDRVVDVNWAGFEHCIGTLVDAAGAPVQGAWVGLAPPEFSDFVNGWRVFRPEWMVGDGSTPSPGVAWATLTSSEGEFRLPGGVGMLTIQHPAFAPVFTVPRADAGLLHLMRGCVLRGAVLAGDGSPMDPTSRDGLSVLVSGFGREGRYPSEIPRQRCRLDAGATFTVSGLAPGLVSAQLLSASDDLLDEWDGTLALGAAEQIVLTANVVHAITLFVRQGGDAVTELRVTDPQPGRSILLVASHDEPSAWTGEINWTGATDVTARTRATTRIMMDLGRIEVVPRVDTYVVDLPGGELGVVVNVFESALPVSVSLLSEAGGERDYGRMFRGDRQEEPSHDCIFRNLRDGDYFIQVRSGAFHDSVIAEERVTVSAATRSEAAISIERLDLAVEAIGPAGSVPGVVVLVESGPYFALKPTDSTGRVSFEIPTRGSVSVSIPSDVAWTCEPREVEGGGLQRIVLDLDRVAGH